MSDTTMTDDDGRQTAERRDERAKWTRDIAEIFRGMTASPDYGAYRIAADFLDPPLAAPTSPSEPVPSTPRVWAMPEIPEDVRRVFDCKGFVWIRDADEPIGRLWERADGRRFAAESQLIIDRGPLVEYVDDLRPEVEETNDGQ